jgi:PTH1 family peptidyl-tRNA hydrolase
MKLIVGLGNPGEKYARNRHNVGFMAVERIASRHRVGPWKKKFQAVAADGEIDGEKVLLLAPQTYMNESGRAVGEAARFLKVDLADIIVLHDELDLAPGKIRFKVGGGNAGHNGLRSITAHLGNDYARVRIGIAPRPRTGRALPDGCRESPAAVGRWGPTEAREAGAR